MIPMEKKTTTERVFVGEVTSDRMQKTIVVRVERTVMHPKYNKTYKVSRKFKVHDENNEYKVGDVVKFVETRPLSKDKRWRVIGKV
jgi:small subunit ribosomal protein S17